MTNRREFLERFGAGLVVMLVSRDALALPLPAGASGTAPSTNHTDVTSRDAPAEQLSAWLHVDARGQVTVFTGKVEFGQGIRTSLAQQVADELRVPFASVHMVMGDTDLTPFDMGTFGSLSTPQMGTKLRTVSAAARAVLIGLAATQWGVEAGSLTAADGRVADPKSGRSIGYGELTAGRQLSERVPDGVELMPAPAWRVAGRTVPKVGMREIVTGRHQYTSDMSLPGMLIGKVVRPPSYGAKLVRFDSGGATGTPGVHAVAEGDFAGVAAPSMASRCRVARTALPRCSSPWKSSGRSWLWLTTRSCSKIL